MTQYLRAIQERSATSADPGTPIRFIASTEGVGRDGIVISAEGWDLENFRANPAFLWSHDYTGNKPPIGRVATVEVKDKQLIADVVFDQGDEFARQIERKYRDGFLNAVSVGWDTKEMEPPKGTGAARVTHAELLDLSAVNIPGDPNALIQRQLRALQELTQTTENTEDTPPPARATWDETAASMVRLICTAAQRPEAERVTEYRALAREYARHGKTPPELLEVETVSALGAGELRGLFLEGEPDLFPNTFALAETSRAGAVLSKRNLDDLGRASELIQGVMARAVKEAETEDPEPIDEARALLLGLRNLGAKP